MWKFLAGLAVGALLTAVLMRWALDEAATPTLAATNLRQAVSTTAPPPPIIAFPPAARNTPGPSPSASANKTPAVAEAANTHSLHQYKLPVTDAVRRIFDANRAAKRKDPDTTWPSDLHDQLERESEDAGWSYYAESNFRQFFADSAPGVVLHAVVCRQTICEVQATLPGPGGPQSWQRISLALSEQPWSQEFHNRTVTSDNNDLLMIFQREPAK